MNEAVYCWGDNRKGQLGNGSSVTYSNVPVPVVGSSSNATAIAAGDQHACAVHDDVLSCWGANESGQVGINPQLAGDKFTMPIPVSGLIPPVTAVGASAEFTCAIANTGAYCWGDGYFGQLEVPLSESNAPIQVTGLSSGVTTLSLGSNRGLRTLERYILLLGRRE